jgi:hypothetical protein
MRPNITQLELARARIESPEQPPAQGRVGARFSVPLVTQ